MTALTYDNDFSIFFWLFSLLFDGSMVQVVVGGVLGLSGQGVQKSQKLFPVCLASVLIH